MNNNNVYDMGYDAFTEKCNNGAYVAPPTATNSTDDNIEFKFDELYPHCSSYNFAKCSICEDTTCCIHPKHDNTNDEKKGGE